FVGLLFVSASAIGAILITHALAPARFRGSPTFMLSRSLAYRLAPIYALTMAGASLMTPSSLLLRTAIPERWTPLLGYAAAAVLRVGSKFLDWTFFLFPTWVLIVSATIVVEEYRRRPKGAVEDEAGSLGG